MLHHHARRLIAGAGLAGTLVAVTAMPASAHRAPADIDIYLGASTVAAGRPGVETSPILFASEPVSLDGLTVSFDSTALAGVATVAGAEGEDCTAATPARLVCTRAFPVELREGGVGGVFDVVITAAPGAKAGDTGTLRVTLAAKGVKPITTQARVRVAEGIDLAAGASITANARPGGSFEAPMTVRNAGRATVRGATVLFFNDYAFQARGSFRNCTYVEGQVRSCTFDQALAPGTAYRLGVPYQLRKDTAAPGGAFGESQWLTPAERDDFTEYLDQFGYTLGTPGTGGTLKLTRTGQARAQAVPQTDVDPDNNWTNIEVDVRGKQGSDLSAVGDEVSGEAGATVEATVGVRNLGPATIDWNRSGEVIARVDVAVPAGSTVVTVPDGCRQVVGGAVDWDAPVQPGARAYRCESGSVFQAGTSETFRFGLRIDEVVPNAAGVVAVNNPCECPQFDKDLDRGNNRAALVVNPTAGDGGQGGGLPVTGPAGTAVAVGGLLLLFVGGGSVFLARRRTRFVA
jgi:hypothetical protein